MPSSRGPTTVEPPAAVLDHVRGLREELLRFLRALVEVESPTDRPQTQRAVQELLADALRELDIDVRLLPGSSTGGHLYGRARWGGPGRPQMLVGHTDTVWPLGTLEDMPLRLEGDVLRGPGVYDMKAGLAQMVFALRTLRELGLEPPAPPLVFVNSDEELGSFESRRWVRRLARVSSRAFVLEPSHGPEGRIKTARKGVGRFEVKLRGRSAHAGLEPEAGASAILELAHVVQALHALNEPARGTTVNVGVVAGGVRPNVVPAAARAEVDVRASDSEEAERVTRRIHAIRPVTPGVRLEVVGGMDIPPLERTPRNRRLWEAARAAGAELGLELEEATAGGGSDGNTTSAYTATLDGLGAVGDGAHATHEHVVVSGVLERCALLARLLLLPVDSEAP